MDTNPVSSTVLEERVVMYLQAFENATAANDISRRQAVEKDIQNLALMLLKLKPEVSADPPPADGEAETLMDLMEQVSVGQMVPANAVPPPLHIHSYAGEPLANALGELSARLADYHKALYYADIEIGENRVQQIQTLQRGLQVIQKLQDKAKAGYPVQPEEIPPPVTLPTDDEFVVDPKSVITERIALYYQAIEVAEDEGKSTRTKTLQDGIQKLEYLLKRADINIPIYKKDLPCSPALGQKFRKQTEQYRTTVELLTKMSGLSARAAKLAAARGDVEKEKQLQHNAKLLNQALKDYESGKQPDMSACPYTLADIERLADEAGVPASQHIQDTETVRLRLNQYKLAALKAKGSGLKDQAIQHMRVMKGLQSLLYAVEKGESIDMTQVPPPPSEQTPTTEEAARLLAQKPVDPSHHKAEPSMEVGGMSLAEELSAFLDDSTPLDNSSSPSETSSSSSSSGSSPEKMLSQSQPQFVLSSPVQRQKGIKLNQTMTPQTSPGSTRSGLNPLYTLTQNAPAVSAEPGLGDTGNRQLTQMSQQNIPNHPPGPAVVPSRTLKPVSGVVNSSVPPQQDLLRSVNGFHGPVLEPIRTGHNVMEVGTNGQNSESKNQLPKQVPHVNGTNESSSEMTCIEIIKYERMQLDKEGSDDAKVAAERLGRQMEEEKQRLREGGYTAWLAYLGQVEEDVTNINCDMKLAREGGLEERLASLIIKKELAERELAVMRKRLPELQS